MSILLYVEHDGKNINEATLKAVTAALQLASFNGVEFHALLADLFDVMPDLADTFAS